MPHAALPLSLLQLSWARTSAFWHAPRPRARWLQPGSFWRLGSPRGGSLQVLQGAVWLTWAGCAEDHFLRRGDRFEVPPARQVMVQPQPGLSPGPAVLRWQPAGWRPWRR